MSSGRVHAAATVTISGIVAGTAATYTGIDYAIMALLGGIYAILISPDLDVDSGNISDGLIRNDMGRFFQLIWRIFWEPYSYAVKHRSVISHGIIIGTVIRIIYLFFPLTVNLYVEEDHNKRGVFLASWLSQFMSIAMMLVITLAFVGLHLHINLDYIIVFIGTVILADALHNIMDRF